METRTLINKELEQREELKRLVMVQILERCSIGKGYVKRGHLNQYVYEKLGYHGQPGNHFGAFMRKLMAEQGFRVSYRTGQRVYYGLTFKEDKCQDQKKPNLENPENAK